MREGSLFTGYGGLGMAASTVLGTRPVWFVENEPAACRVLAHHHPGVPNLGDITTVDWTQVEPVEVLTGGFPCQDISNAGKRAGIEGDRSGLWSYFADAIRVLRPRYVLIENVAALVIRGLDRVLADLAALGFDAEWTTVRASDVGAPHRRERVFIAARNTTDSGRHPQPATRPGQHQERPVPVGRSDCTSQDADLQLGAERRPAGSSEAEGGRSRSHTGGRGLCAFAAADPQGDGRHEGGTEPAGLVGGSDAAERGASPSDTDSGRRGWHESNTGRGQVERAAADRNRAGSAPAADTDSERLEGRGPVGSSPSDGRRLGDTGRAPINWGAYEPAIRRWEYVLGRSAPVPAVLSAGYLKMRRRRLAGQDRRPVGMRGSLRPVRVLNPALPEWMMGLPDGWITAVPGLSRNEQLRLAGNGVCPQQATAAFAHLLPLLNPAKEAA